MSYDESTGLSDYGFYGKTGQYDASSLPKIKPDKKGDYPILECEYDDTPGFRETTYNLKSKDDKLFTYALGNIHRAIDCWNALVDEEYFRNRMQDAYREFSNALSLYRPSLMGESQKASAEYAVRWILLDIEKAKIKTP